jgi:hypothetical protein
MKATRRILLLFFLLTGIFSVQAQRGGRRAHPRAQRAHVVKRSIYRPAKIVVYHPVWGPKFSIYRRWVFFPRYNFYWDNWRNQYLFWNGMAWVIMATPPPAVINVNLQTEQHYELKENEDDLDDVYKNNSTHKQEYKTE